MSDQPQQHSGRDLARQALAAYKANRHTTLAGKSRPRAKTRVRDRSSGRDPVAFGALIDRLGREQGWDTALKGGSITDRWSSLCPTQYADKLRPTAFDPQTGTLRLVTDSPAVATDLRILGSMLIQHLNKQLRTDGGKGPIRRLNVQLGNLGSHPRSAEPEPPTSAPEPGPVRTRETASPGYRRVLELARTHKPAAPPESPLVAAARAELDAFLADPANREIEAAFADAVAALEAAQPPDTDPVEASRQAAIRYKRSGEPTVRRLFEAS